MADPITYPNPVFGFRIPSRWLRRGAATTLFFSLGMILQGAEDEIVQLPDFEVSTSHDRGYLTQHAVTPLHTDAPIKDLPFTVHTFTAPFINDTHARDLLDVVQYAPGVTSAGQQFTGGNAIYSIRGFYQRPQRNGFSGDPYVDTATVERVEVVKGPSSVLYGQVSPGGIINYLTKRPQPEGFATVATEVGSYRYARATADINQPLSSDRLLFRLNAAAENAPEYFAHAKGKTWVIDPVLRWKPSDRVSVVVDYQWFKRREIAPVGAKPSVSILSSPGFLLPGPFGHYPFPRTFNYSSIHDWRHSEFNALDAEISARLNEHWEARINFDWHEVRTAQKQTGTDIITATFFPGNPFYLGIPGYVEAFTANPTLADLASSLTLRRVKEYETESGRVKTLQTEAVGSYAFAWGKITPTVGALYGETSTGNEIRLSGSAGYPDFPSWNLRDRTTFVYETDFDPGSLPQIFLTRAVSRNRAAYGIVSASLDDSRLLVVTGLRYNRAGAESADHLHRGIKGIGSTSIRVVPQFALGYKIAPSTLIYGSYSESFTSQPPLAFLQPTTASLFGTASKPTTSVGYEIGAKTELLEKRLSVSAAVYRIDENNRVLNFDRPATGTSGDVEFSFPASGASDRSEGIEVEAVCELTPQWEAYFSAAENNIWLTKLPSGLDTFIVHVGSHPENSVKTLANFWTRYTVDRGLLRGLWFGAGLNYTGRKAARQNNSELFLSPATLLNAALGYDWQGRNYRGSFTLAGENLRNIEYFPTNQQRGLPARLEGTLKLTF